MGFIFFFGSIKFNGILRVAQSISHFVSHFFSLKIKMLMGFVLFFSTKKFNGILLVAQSISHFVSHFFSVKNKILCGFFHFSDNRKQGFWRRVIVDS